MALSCLLLLAVSVRAASYSASGVDLSEYPNIEGGPLITIPSLAKNFNLQFEVIVNGDSGLGFQELMSLSSTSYGDILRIEALNPDGLLYILVNENNACWESSEAPLSDTTIRTVMITLVDLWWSLYIDSALQCEDALSNEHQQPTFTDAKLFPPPPSLDESEVAKVVISNVYIEDHIDDSELTPLPTTPSPTDQSTKMPSSQPASKPTRRPTSKPTRPPTSKPTGVPSHKPTNTPTSIPTFQPSWNPSDTPTQRPTWNPTETPTEKPAYNPTKRPSGQPTRSPTAVPTRVPTNEPSEYPTLSPTMESREDPTLNPTAEYMRGPVIRNASFTDNFISIEVRFDVDTNYGELPSNQDFDCSKLFTTNTTAMFDEPNAPIGSSTSYCTWGKADRLLIFLGYNPWVDIGSELEFLPQTNSNKNAIRTAGSFVGGYLNITAPIMVEYPSGWPDEVLLSRSVTINGPSQIGQCGSASFDAYTTGTAGRSITNYSWSITPALVPSCILETSAARVEIPMGCIELGISTISVNVTNWLGMRMGDKFQFEMLRLDPPQVTVNGGNNIIIQAGEQLEITLQVAPPSCLTADLLGGYSTAYSYWWYQSSEQESIKPYDELTFNSNNRNFGNSAKLVILSSDLIPGNFYEIKCKVDYQDNAGNFSDSLTSIGFSVFWELPISLVEGTTKYLIIGENYTASLEDNYIWPKGSGSEDYYFTVECDDCADHLTLTSSSLVFTPAFEGEYAISLTAKHKVISVLSVSTQFTVSVNNTVTLSQLIFELRDSEGTLITQITPGYRSVLTVSALPENEAYYYTFSIMVAAEGFFEVDGSDFWDRYAIFADNEKGVLVFSGYSNSTQLKNEVKIQVMVAVDGDMIKLEKTYNINSAPTGGLCSTTPEEGTINTIFEFFCLNWEDDSNGNIDVNFRYKRLDNIDGFSLEEFEDSYEDGIYKWNGLDGDCGGSWLTAWTTTRSITKTLPTAGVYLVCAYLRDSLGATATVHNLVTVTDEVIFNPTAIANLTIELKDAVNKTDYFKTAAIVERIVSNTDSLANKQEGLEVRADIIQTLRTIQVSSREDVEQLSKLSQGALGSNSSEMDVDLVREALVASHHILESVDTYTSDDQPIPTEVADAVTEMLGTVAGAPEEIGEDLEDEAKNIITTLKAVLTLSIQGTIPGEHYQSGDRNNDIFAQAQRVGDALPNKCGGDYFQLPSNLTSTFLNNNPSCNFFRIPPLVIKGATYGNSSGGLYSPVISLTFFSDQDDRRRRTETIEIDIEIDDACSPIIVSLPYSGDAGDVFDSVASANNSTQNYSFEYSAYFPNDSIEAEDVKPIVAPLCQWYDMESNSWNSTGCELLQNTGSEAICQCLHLTEFGVGLKDFIPEINVLTPYDFRQVNFENMRKHPTVPLVLLGLLVLVPCAFCIVERENDKHLLAQPMLWSSYQLKIIEESYYGKTASIKKSNKPRCLKLMQLSWLDVKNKHMFYGLWMRDRGTNFTGAQRVGVILLVLLMSLCESAAFYGQHTMKMKFDELVVIIYGAAFTSLIPVVVTELFVRHQPKMYKPTRLVKEKGRISKRDIFDIQTLEGLTLDEISQFAGLQPSTLERLKTNHDLRIGKSLGIGESIRRYIFGVRTQSFETPKFISENGQPTTYWQTENLGIKTKSDQSSIMTSGRSRQNIKKRDSTSIEMITREPHSQIPPVIELSAKMPTAKDSWSCLTDMTESAGERHARKVSAGEIDETCLPTKSCSRANIKSRHVTSSEKLALRSTKWTDYNTSSQQIDGNEITEIDCEILNKLQEILLQRSFWVSKRGRLLTWIIIVLTGIGCFIVTLTYGLQFDLKEDCLSNVLSNGGCEQLITFEELVSNEVSLGYCDIYQSEPMWDQSSYWSTINAPTSARWLLSFSLSFLLSTFIFTVFSMTAVSNIRQVCCRNMSVDAALIPEIIETKKTSSWSWKRRSKKATPREADQMISMDILDQGVHDDSCMYELVLDSECIPAEVSLRHLVENPEVLLEFGRKKAKWKKVEAQEIDEERQLPLAPDMNFTPLSMANHFESFAESVVQPGEPKGNNKENAKQQDVPQADNGIEEIRL